MPLLEWQFIALYLHTFRRFVLIVVKGKKMEVFTSRESKRRSFYYKEVNTILKSLQVICKHLFCEE